jgi:hypothetical protein
MTKKLVVIINSLKVTKIKKILLHEVKFLVPNYSCLQNHWLGGYRSQIPVLSILCPQLNLLNPPRTKFLGTPLAEIKNGGIPPLPCTSLWCLYGLYAHSTKPQNTDILRNAALFTPTFRIKNATNNITHYKYSHAPHNCVSVNDEPHIQGVPGGMCQTSGGCSLC